MSFYWVRIEDGLPKDNGRIQKILVCTNRKVSSFQNCDIEIAFFTDHFHKDELVANVSQITHWCYIEKPEDLKQINEMRDLFVNTENEEDIVTLEEIKRRYIDIQGTAEGFGEYVANGFRDGIEAEYSWYKLGNRNTSSIQRILEL